MKDGNAVQVSIVVACRNEIRCIRRFLDSLLAQDMTGIPWEAIIADGMSDDGTCDVLEQYSARHSKIRVVTNPGRIVSSGLNAAIRRARGHFIIRMDAHSWYAQNYCRLCMETLERTGADYAGGPVQAQGVGAQARAVAAAYQSRFSTGGARFHDVNYEGWVDTLPYGCWHKQTLLRLGLFDETLVRNQDDELSLRLTRAGGRIWQNPAILSWYSPRPTLASLFHQYFQYGFWKVAVIRKHRLPASWRHVVPVAFVLSNFSLISSLAVTKAIGMTPWFNAIAVLWLALAGAYAFTTLIVSIIVARRHGWVTFLYLPAVFATYHLSYGLGFLVGLPWYFKASGHTFYFQSIFTRITR